MKFEEKSMEELIVPEGMNLLPPLPEREYALLKDDIAANGIKVPILTDKDLNILDGIHRYNIGLSLGIKRTWAQIDEQERTPEERDLLIFRLNLLRRHLSPEKSAELSVKMLNLAVEILRAKEGKEPSVRELGKHIGLSKSNVQRIKKYEEVIEDDPSLKEKGITRALKIAKDEEKAQEEAPDFEEKSRKSIIAECELILSEVSPDILKKVPVLLSFFIGSEHFREKTHEIMEKEKWVTQKARNPLQKIVLEFKKVAGFAGSDLIWNKIYFPRYIKTAKILLDVCDLDIDRALEAINKIGTFMESKNLTWTLGTIIKHAPYLKKNSSRYAIEENKPDINEEG